MGLDMGRWCITLSWILFFHRVHTHPGLHGEDRGKSLSTMLSPKGSVILKASKATPKGTWKSYVGPLATQTQEEELFGSHLSETCSPKLLPSVMTEALT